MQKTRLIKLGTKKVNTSQAEKIRKQPGKSNAGQYPKVKSKDFAGADGTFPINSTDRAKSALKLAHNASNPDAVKEKVYAKYPFLRPRGK